MAKRVKVYNSSGDEIEIWEDSLPKYIKNGWSEKSSNDSKPKPKTNKYIQKENK